MEKIKRFVLNVLRSSQKDASSDDIVLQDSRYKACSGEFHTIDVVHSDNVTFIDGGSALIIDSAAFCIGKIRIVACCFDSSRKSLSNKLFEAYVLCSYKDEKTLCAQIDIIHNDIGIDISLLEIEVAIDDEEFVSKTSTLTPAMLLDKVRRLAELHCVVLSSGLVCLDGSLRCQDHIEKSVLSQIQKKNVCGVCKTNSLVTKKHMVISLKEKGYRRIASALIEDVPDLYMAKMHASSHYTFIVESFGKISDTIAQLALFSDDPRFFGYPYGLIKADKLARISNQEVSREQVKLRVIFKDEWKEMEQFVHTRDAHDILDKIA